MLVGANRSLLTPTRWSPMLLGTKLKAWWDHSDESTLWQDTAATTPVVADTNPVGRVNDKSGNGLHKLQATGAAQPLWRSTAGKPRLVYDGTNDYMSIATPAFPLPTLEVYVLASAITSSDATDRGLVTCIDGPIGGGAGSHDHDDTGAFIFAIRGSVPHLFNYRTTGTINTTVAFGSAQVANAHRYELINETTVATIRTTAGTGPGDVEGSDSSFAAFAATNAGPYIEAARHYTAAVQNFLGISIHETVIASGLTASERQELRSYLDKKWR